MGKVKKIGENIKGMLLSTFKSDKPNQTVIKKSELINGKKIEVQIYFWNLKFVNDNLIQEFKKITINGEKNLRTLADFHQISLNSIVCNMAFQSFFDACKEYLNLIPSDNLKIVVVFSDVQRTMGVFNHLISTEDYAFFSFYTYYAIAQAHKIYSLRDPTLIKIINENRFSNSYQHFTQLLDFIFPDSAHIHYTQDFRTTVLHEFIHYLDVGKIKSKDTIIKRIARAVHPRTENDMREIRLTTLPTPETLVDSINVLRMEGLATFGQNKGRIMNYNLNLVREFKQFVNSYSSGPIFPYDKREFYYTCGGYICYFISLIIISKKGQSRISELRAFFDVKGKDFVFLSEGFENIFRLLAERGLEEIYFQMPSKNEIDETIREITSLSHIGFIKMYEESCNTLQVPNDQILITLADYKIAKKRCYDYWIENIRREGFPTDGIESGHE